ncbi:MAG: four helix bundle protein [Salinivirgaceae bacterium]|nr:four helix bundle protein [Salinivirgaceae bacterium]
MEYMDKYEFREGLKNRTKQFALACIKFYQSLPSTGENRIIGNQFLRSATSVAANYRAACRARSGNEFYSKICIVVEEADETLFWLEMLTESGIVTNDNVSSIYQENEEIVKIMATIKKNSKPESNKSGNNQEES